MNTFPSIKMFYSKNKTNFYAISRSLLAFNSLLLLLFNDINELIPKDYYLFIKENLFQSKYNFFMLFEYDNLYIAKLISCFFLILVIVGTFPFVTGLIHFWMTYSLFYSVMAIEGGDQLALIITAFLLPVSLFDNRVSQWSEEKFFNVDTSAFITYFCYSCLVIIRVQVSLLYFDAGVEKLKVDEWVDGTATYYWFNHSLFGAPNWLKFLFSWMFTDQLLVTLITWGVIALEILLFASIFMPEQNKKYFFVLGVSFHFIIFLTHGLPNFFLNMTAALILYLLPASMPFIKKNKSETIWALQ